MLESWREFGQDSDGSRCEGRNGSFGGDDDRKWKRGQGGVTERQCVLHVDLFLLDFP